MLGGEAGYSIFRSLTIQALHFAMTLNVATPPSLTSPLNAHLEAHIRKTIEAAGGWLAFDRFMEMALYTPYLGYYAHDSRKFGSMPAGVKDGGGDFVTAPEMSPYFGRALAAQFLPRFEKNTFAYFAPRMRCCTAQPPIKTFRLIANDIARLTSVLAVIYSKWIAGVIAGC